MPSAFAWRPQPAEDVSDIREKDAFLRATFLPGGLYCSLLLLIQTSAAQCATLLPSIREESVWMLAIDANDRNSRRAGVCLSKNKHRDDLVHVEQELSCHVFRALVYSLYDSCLSASPCF
jgi:hypothetical protein